MFIDYFYKLPEAVTADLQLRTPKFGHNGFGEAVYYRTYSRRKADGRNETWADTVTRVVEGNVSIAYDYCIKNKIDWDKDIWDSLARKFADYIFEMRFLPPGRSLWAMGTLYVAERGGAALQNCGFTEVKVLSQSAGWLMDMLMCGVGVGFSTHTLEQEQWFSPNDSQTYYTFTIPDSREGWVESVERLIQSYEQPNEPKVQFDYGKIRPAGAPINGFGGTASGYEPLEKVHQRIREYLNEAARQSRNQQPISKAHLVTDVMNAIGACVVAGNVRRSAEISIGLPNDEEFLNLKNYELYPDREEIGWMSNNSVLLQTPDDFLLMPDIAQRIKDNGEPGIINMMNTRKYGRFKEKLYGEDAAVGFNPCGEQPLEPFELCNLVEVFPTRCETEQEIYDAMELATIWATNVSLLPTHREETNAVMQKNHRIGVSLSGIADFVESTSIANATKVMRYGYEQIVRPTNKLFLDMYGKQPSIRVTTVKPSGTLSQLVGVSPGMHWPTDRYVIRRMRVNENETNFCDTLKNAGYAWERDVYSDNTLVFEFPLDQSKSRSAREVPMYHQLSFAAWIQREWSDNGVSCTIYFQKSEEKEIEHALSMFAPQIKAISMLPHTEEGAYKQMPYEKISSVKYHEILKNIKPINWSQYTGSDGADERFCDTGTGSCEVILGKK